MFRQILPRSIRSAARLLLSRSRRPRTSQLLDLLEPRVLFSESATAQIALTSMTGSGAGTVYHYDITVNDTGTTNIGTFWFSWLPGADFLPSAPLTTSDPAGWGDAVTGSNNQLDGSAIEWTANSNLITPGHSLSGFDFTSPDSPSALAGKSPTHASADVLLSTVYSGAPFSDSGDTFDVSQVAATAASTTTVVPSQATINQGDPVSFTATVAPTSGSGTDPTGSVTFFENGNSIGSQPLVSGSATLMTSALPSGLLSITAQYGGDSNYSSSTSTAITETVNPPAPTTTTLMTSNPTVNSGDPVTLTATIAPITPGGTPTGTVTFIQGADTLGMVSLAPDGTAQLLTSTLPVGADQITATYSGDTHFAASASTTITETVNPGTAASTTTLMTSAASAHSGDSVTFTATVAPATPGGAAPAGTVTFTQDGVTLGSAPVQSDGTAVLATSALPLGTDNITASYSGDANYAASASSPLIETVTTPATLAPTIAKSTVPSALVTGTAAHGAVTLDIANMTQGTIKGKITVQLFATTNGVIDGSSVQLAQVVRPVNVKTTRPAAMPLPVKIGAGALGAGSYTLVVRVIDLSGNNNDSTAGPALTVAAAFVSLSETFTRMTIPSSVASGAKVHAVAALRITNDGNVTTPGSTTVALFAAASGVIDGSATQIAAVTKPLRIHAGKSSMVAIPVHEIPALAAGTYTIVVQVTDANGRVSTASSITVTVTA